MQILRCALGVIQKKGHSVIRPVVQQLGAAEQDYLARHVGKVRARTDVGIRSLFMPRAATPAILGALRSASDGAEYESQADNLQTMLAQAMKTSTNAKDCVFAAVEATESPNADHYVTLLKLDAVIEAARMKRLQHHGVTFEVLKGLLPEPGKLQKALSWPDPRSPVSEVMMLDMNAVNAQYFENAYQVLVSPKATEAEELLAETIHRLVPVNQISAAIESSADLDGPLDVVLATMAEDYPELSAAATIAATDPRPAGMVRRNKAAARPVVWRADGIELRVPAQLAGRVTVAPQVNGWRITVDTVDEPTRD